MFFRCQHRSTGLRRFSHEESGKCRWAATALSFVFSLSTFQALVSFLQPAIAHLLSLLGGRGNAVDRQDGRRGRCRARDDGGEGDALRRCKFSRRRRRRAAGGSSSSSAGHEGSGPAAAAAVARCAAAGHGGGARGRRERRLHFVFLERESNEKRRGEKGKLEWEEDLGSLFFFCVSLFFILLPRLHFSSPPPAPSPKPNASGPLPRHLALPPGPHPPRPRPPRQGHARRRADLDLGLGGARPVVLVLLTLKRVALNPELDSSSFSCSCLSPSLELLLAPLLLDMENYA
jgi:hypothetical protein